MFSKDVKIGIVMPETGFPGYAGARAAVLELLRPYEGKTLAGVWIEDEPKEYEDRHQSERLRLVFSDGSEVRLQVGTNLNTLGGQEGGYHLKSANELS